MHNYAKSFLNNFIAYKNRYCGCSSYCDMKSDISDLIDKFAIRFNKNTMCWTSKFITVEGVDLGRFDIKIEFDRDIRSWAKPRRKNVTHPHMGRCIKGNYRDLCIGNQVMMAFYNGRFYDGYKMSHISMSNMEFDDARMMTGFKTYDRNKMLEMCTNYHLTTKCVSCGTIKFKDECHNIGCRRSPYFESDW